MLENKKYVTLENGSGKDFRTIADLMSDKGYQMNHATARNTLISAIRNLMKNVSVQFHTYINDKQIERLIQDQSFHNSLADILYVAYQKLQSYKEKK